MIDDQHLHTCPFKPGGVAQLLCADACGYNRCTGRGDKPDEEET